MSLLTASKQMQSNGQTESSTAAAAGTASQPVPFVDTPPDNDSSPSASGRGPSTAAPSPDSSHSQGPFHSHSQQQPQPPPQLQSQNHLQLPHRLSRTTAPTTPSDSPLPLPHAVLALQQSSQTQNQQQQSQPETSPSGSELPPFIDILRLPPINEIDISPGLAVSFAEADRALDEYRTTYSPHFPFVPIADHVKAFDLYQDQPLFFRMIVQAVVPQSPQVQRDAKRYFRSQIALHVVTDEEKDLSLLQAILLYVAWSDAGYYIDPKVTPLLQLATGLVSDLGLHRPVHHETNLTLNAFIDDAATALRGFGYVRQNHSLQSMRAAIGCYYVCALNSSFFRRTPVFPFTAYMDACCDKLLARNEFTSDALAVALTRMHRVAARIYAVLPNPEGGNLDADNPTVAPPSVAPSLVAQPNITAFAPVYMSMATLRQELDRIVLGTGDTPPLAPSVQSDCFLWTHYHAIIVRIYEPAIYLRMRPSVATSSVDLADTGLRTEALWNCLQATRDFFDAYAAVPPTVLGVLPLMGTVHLSFGIVTLTRLLSLDCPEWHIGQARRSFDFVALALRLEQQFAAADDQERTMPSRKKRYANIDNRTSLATHRDKMRWIRIWYTTKMPPDPHQIVRSRPPPVPPAVPLTTGTSANGMTASNTPVSSVSSAAVPQQQPLPFPFPGTETSTDLLQQQQPQNNMMDVDTDTTGSRNSANSNDRQQVVLPDGLTVPLDEFDSTFWKAIFDLDSNTWEPTMV
ncbi:hypothetical protein SBRCBS47491_002118 [Sporothrix bragantina]|uniref:Uncharacterized protein n=1 Tax=Sporothrix bragantina TaxID=671064 RepID=A0ABP0B4G5_9PEZI